MLFLPLYSWMVTVVEALDDHDLIESFELRSQRKSIVASVFDVGDTLIVVAASGAADYYELEVYDNSSSVFVHSGAFDAGSVQVHVPLSPPLFMAGRSYLVVFVAHAYDYLIPGASASDTVPSSFAIVAVGTKLALETEYDVSPSSLVLNANLTTVDGFPVSNEKVDFGLQFDRQRRTEGWVPLASVKTNFDGSARANLAFGLSSGNYRIRAVHGGNENYGKSEVFDRVTVVSNITDGTSNSTSSSAGAPFPRGNVGNLSLHVPSSTPYVLLPLKATSTYVVNVTLQGSVWILFFLDHTKSSRFLSSARVEHNGTVPYVYETSLFWCSGILGSHKIISGVVNGSAADLEAAMKNGAGLINSAEVEVVFQRCPVNVVLDFPDAFYGGVFPVTVAVSKPRPYETDDDGLCVTSSLAPRLPYDGVEYAVDEGVESVPVKLYINGALAFQNLTDSFGLANFLLSVSLNNSRVRAAVKGSALLSDKAVEEDLFFRRVSVLEVAGYCSSFKFDFGLSNGAEAGKLYIAVDSRLKAESSFLNQSVWNLPVSMLYGKFVSTAQTDGSGRASVPAGSGYLRVSCFGTIGGGGGKDNNPEDANPYPYVVFDSGQTEYLDSQRFARVPVGATSLTFCYDCWSNGATIEFFKIAAEGNARTDRLGRVDASWVPNELGKYVVQVTLPSQFDLFVSSSANIFLTFASTNLFRYFDVVKRPVALSLSHSPKNGGVSGGGRDVNLEGTDDVEVNECVDFVLSAVDGATSGPGSGMPIECFVNNASLGTVFTNSSGVAVFSWTPASNIVYNVVASYCGDGIYEASIASLTFDLRYPTNLGLWLESPPEFTYRLEIADNSTVNVDTLVNYQFSVNDLPPNSGGESVKVYVDGSFYKTVQVSGSPPTANFNWTADSTGVHYINASYGGNMYYKPDYLYFAANASASPVSLDFTVTPTTFEVGGSVNLWAKAINSLTRLPVHVEIGFWRDGYGSGVQVDYGWTDGNGVVTGVWTYPSDGSAHTIVAKVKENSAVASVTLAIRPITLTVGVETKLWLWVERGLTNTEHTVHARLVRAKDTVPISGQPIKLDVSGTVYTLTTNGTGYATQPLDLVAVGGQTTMYQIRAVFEGAGFKTRSLSVKDPYGRDYPVCTTMQWDFKPSQNSVTLTVEAPKTDVTSSTSDEEATVTQDDESTTATVPPPKTPEQAQKEASDQGWLQVWPEFSWSYPWFRLHVKININPTIEVAFNPVLPGGETYNWTGVGLVSAIIEDIWQDIVLDLLGIFAGYIMAKSLSLWNIAAGVVIEIGKGVVQGAFLYQVWNDRMRLLATAIASILMGLVAIATNIGEAFVNNLMNLIAAPTRSAFYLVSYKMIVVAQPLKYIRSPVDYMEAAIDFTIGGLAILRYLGRI